MDASVIGEIMGVVDSKGTGSCDLSSLTEAVLSGLEEKKVSVSLLSITITPKLQITIQ